MMLERVVLVALEHPGTRSAAAALEPAVARLSREFPAIAFEPVAHGGAPEATAWLAARDWSAPRFDLGAFDARMNDLAARGPVILGIAGEAVRLSRVGLEILTRCQRLSARRNEASRGALFDGVLAAHRALHELDRPLVRADYDHALDTWQWVLRLSPSAGVALQAAALFHDVERLASEAERRIEHRALDYQAFKDAHAAGGARVAEQALAGAGLPPGEIERASRLVASHERPRGDPELDLLNDADALSFFSLNSGGFMDYYGPSHTRRKVVYTLARMRPEARLRLPELRLRADVARLAEAAAELAGAPAAPAGERR